MQFYNFFVFIFQVVKHRKPKKITQHWVQYACGIKVFRLAAQDTKAEGRGRIARIQRRLLVAEAEERIMQYQNYVEQGSERDAKYTFGLILYSLDRLYSVVKRHAEDSGEWQRLRQDIIKLASPRLQTDTKLIVMSNLKILYDCLLPVLKSR
ncbi:unnamed protein product [Lathyrus sativus]|nr:unnamed protein product [Lathyrus sativus]